MSFVRAITQFFARSATDVVPTPLFPLPPDPIPAGLLAESPAVSSHANGQVVGPHQERTLAYHNNEMSGYCAGTIQLLTGPTVVCAFEDLPSWMRSLVVSLSVEAEAGRLMVSVRRADGTLLSVAAPGTLEENVALVGGQLQFECRADREPVRGIRYQITII